MPVFTLVNNAHVTNYWSTSPSGTYNVGDTITLDSPALQHWYRLTGWRIIWLNWPQSETIIYNEDVLIRPYTFSMPNNDVTAEAILGLVEYMLLMNDPYYSYPPERVNPDGEDMRFTVETPTFTLSRPTKTWYTFIWWAGSNWSVPQLDVTIPQGTAWDKVYYANWEALEVQYTVYHMLEGGTTYTETLTGYSGTYTQAVAHNYPWYEQYGQINQSIINGDWSTYVLISYRRVTPVTWWWIMINGQALSKRYINWQEVQKVMVNGSQVRPI